ncbi:MAG: bacteriocin [Candidatus Aminicenantes bacterium]|nr:bacteriocin [Candidatus Aminicenantes bacterium]NIM77392.1 bacteriocin [Candidatus Aminicenantes bacterium]NIN16689.1 bacteriocin [Candidatus Aminicenantes bacterium]NIN40545.1 bacteriocin [Candidatus Aminicenantes bacterium]NIN83365.1 bacteriocin [Candidatus Aminicenantes bacterium]
MKKEERKIKKLTHKEMKSILGGMNKTELVKSIAEKG